MSMARSRRDRRGRVIQEASSSLSFIPASSTGSNILPEDGMADAATSPGP